jgi:hypothetical protein
MKSEYWLIWVNTETIKNTTKSKLIDFTTANSIREARKAFQLRNKKLFETADNSYMLIICKGVDWF